MYRKDNNKPYSPENCYYEECTHNNRVDAVVSYKGKEYTLKELSQHPNCEVGYDILSNRIFQYGMSPEKSLSKDYAPEAFRNLNKEITAFGETKTAKEWSLDFRCKVSYYKLVDRVFRNFTDPEMAMATNNHLTYRKSSCELTLKQIKDKCNELLGGTYAVVGEFSEFYGVSGIYGIFNTISGKIYVGQAISKDGIGGRLSEHQWDLEKNQHDNIHLQRSWNKRGDHAFAFLMLETFKEVTPDTATQRECFWINYFGSKNDDLGYNINDPKNGRLGITNRKITTEQVKSWIKMFINDNDKLPSCIDTSSIIYDELGISWKNLDQNLRRGFNGFPGQQTLKQITHEVISKKHINKNKISKRKSNGNKEQQ
jgi:group I intron endonuclease